MKEKTKKDEKIILKATTETGTTFDENTSIEFLKSEYNQCFNQMRHYDVVAQSFNKFALTGYVAVISGLSALFKFLEAAAYRDIVIGGLSLVAFFVGLVMLDFMVRNRVYYVIVARQVNSIRKYFLKNANAAKELYFVKYEKSYIDPRYPPAFHLSSTYTRLFILIAILNGGLFGAGLFFFTYKGVGDGWEWVIIGIVSVLMAGAQMGLAWYFLHRKDLPQKADRDESSG